VQGGVFLHPVTGAVIPLDTHSSALRAVANRLVGILHGCLRTHTTYNEHLAWGHRSSIAA
jgi:hypothetical protein